MFTFPRSLHSNEWSYLTNLLNDSRLLPSLRNAMNPGMSSRCYCCACCCCCCHSFITALIKWSRRIKWAFGEVAQFACCSVWVGVSNDGMSTITPTGGSCISKQLERVTLPGKVMLRPHERQGGRSIGNPLMGDGAVMHRGHTNGKRQWRGRAMKKQDDGKEWEREP